MNTLLTILAFIAVVLIIKSFVVQWLKNNAEYEMSERDEKI